MYLKSTTLWFLMYITGLQRFSNLNDFFFFKQYVLNFATLLHYLIFIIEKKKLNRKGERKNKTKRNSMVKWILTAQLLNDSMIS
jgi:hypothetical protein